MQGFAQPDYLLNNLRPPRIARSDCFYFACKLIHALTTCTDALILYRRRPMLPLRTRRVLVAGKPVQVYDGEMWFSKGQDMTEFHQRRPKVKTTIQTSLGRWRSEERRVGKECRS